ncbi:diaminopimelate decarboxylase [Pelagibacteraceae bacterium]|nr:diaminopimelate decarboxylase [Pelagibacteraceae bacterium]
MIHYNNNRPFVEGVSLEDIAKTQATPFYVYSQSKITNNFALLKNTLDSEIFYAVKANSNQAIIKLMASLGAGADVVSVGELERAILAGVEPQKIIFEGIGKTKQDIAFAIEKNIRLINIESIDELERVNEVGIYQNKKINIGIRLNPNIDGQTLDKISTGKKTDKFGIDTDKLDEIFQVLKVSKNVNLIGVSCHIGSQIFNINVFAEIFQKMKANAQIFIDKGYSIRHVDLGGGLGVNYHKDQKILNLDLVKNEINKCYVDVPYKLSFEPGRYLVANAGILVTTVITIKNNGGINYLITDAGMHTLMRPALYQARHDIESVSGNIEEQIDYTIAGPICESSDIFEKNVSLPHQQIGNLIIIKDAGAYGKVMASNYNSRGLPLEILVKDNNFFVIHKPLSTKEFIDQDRIPEWLT